uniref:Uncharacterized protein n=1 Tax=Cyanistes caeruleus TaxID=156563 RepID=A0A8C0VMR5_CYACU
PFPTGPSRTLFSIDQVPAVREKIQVTMNEKHREGSDLERGYKGAVCSTTASFMKHQICWKRKQIFHMLARRPSAGTALSIYTWD